MPSYDYNINFVEVAVLKWDFKSLWPVFRHGLVGPWCGGWFCSAPARSGRRLEPGRPTFLLCVVWLQRCSATAATVTILGWGEGQGGRSAGLDELHVIGREHSKMAVGAVAPPPALVDHLDPGDDLVRVEGDLGVVGWKRRESTAEKNLGLCIMRYDRYLPWGEIQASSRTAHTSHHNNRGERKTTVAARKDLRRSYWAQTQYILTTLQSHVSLDSET